jgi:hypothetical protein
MSDKIPTRIPTRTEILRDMKQTDPEAYEDAILAILIEDHEKHERELYEEKIRQYDEYIGLLRTTENDLAWFISTVEVYKFVLPKESDIEKLKAALEVLGRCYEQK